MLGAIAGDVIGSVYEFANTTDKDFPLFSDLSKVTDDTVLTVAVAECLMQGEPYLFGEKIRQWALAYPNSGYSDTIACIAGGIAEAFYGGVPKTIETETLKRLPREMKEIVDRFYAWKPL